MKEPDWAKIYAVMDRRIALKYAQLPEGEQLGKRPDAAKPQEKKS